MSAPTWQTESHDNATLGADPIITKPTGTVDGDLLVAVGVQSSTATITAPAGWTTHPSSLGTGNPLWYRVASGEGASYQFTVSGSSNSIITIARYSGCNPSNPIAAASGVAGVGTLVIPALTSPGAGTVLAQIATKLNNTTFTPPGTATERWDAISGSACTAGGDEVVGAGSTGTRTWTPASGSSNGVAYMLALNASGVEGAGVTLVETVTTTATATVGKTATGSRTQTVSLTASGSTNISGQANLGVVATRTVVGAGAGVAEGVEIVSLNSAGVAGTHSDVNGQFVANFSAGGDIGAVGTATRTATVTLTASGGMGANASLGVTTGLTAAGRPGANADVAVAVSLTATGSLAQQATGSMAVGVSLTATGATNTFGGGSLSVGVDLDATAVRQRWFEPHTQPQSYPDHFWGRFDIPVGISVVKVGGHYTDIPVPTNDELTGIEGVDYFRGGYRYDVSEDVWADLVADGYAPADP